MGFTLTELQYLDTDFIVKGLYYHIMKADNGLMAKLKVRPYAGNGMKYDVKTERADIPNIDRDEDVPESSGTIVQRSAAIYITAHDSLLFDYDKATNSTQDPWVTQLESDMEDFMFQVLTMMIRGQTSTLSTAKDQKGLLRLLAELESESTVDLDALNNTQVIANSATSGAMTEAKLDELIDACDGCNVLAMSKRARRKMNALARASGSILRVEQDGYGKFIQIYNEIPVHIDKQIPDNLPDNSSSVCSIASWNPSTTRAATVDNSPVFALRVGDDDGFCILQAGGFTAEAPFRHPKKLADVRRKKWFLGFGLFSKYAAAVLTGMNPDD